MRRHTIRYMAVNLEALNRFDNGAKIGLQSCEKPVLPRADSSHQDSGRRRTHQKTDGERACLQRFGQIQDRSERRRL
jgi:hypothetical protein